MNTTTMAPQAGPQTAPAAPVTESAAPTIEPAIPVTGEVNYVPVPLEIGGSAPEPEPVRRQAPQRRRAVEPDQEEQEPEVQSSVQPVIQPEIQPTVQPTSGRAIGKFDQDVVMVLLGAVLAVALTFGLAAGMLSNARKSTAIAVAEVKIEQLESAIKVVKMELTSTRSALAAEVAKPWWKRLNRWW